MRKLLVLLIGLVTSILYGVGYQPAPEKVYEPAAYYKGLVSEGEPDFQATFHEYSSFGMQSIDTCDKSGVKLPSGILTYVPTSKYNLRWFWGMPSNTPNPRGYLKEYSVDNPIGYVKIGNMYTWVLPSGMRNLVAVGNATLIASTQNAISPYPKEGQSEGVHLGLIVKIPEARKAFKITYGSMERWWCCMKKRQPDNKNTSQPIYGHTVQFSDNDSFYAGAVIGLAGTSGISSPENGKYYLSIEIESSTLDDTGDIAGVWVPARIEDLYPEISN